MIHTYLQTYAEDHGLVLQVRLNTVVEKAERCDEGWRLSFRDSDEGIVTEKLIVPTRVTSIPNLSKYDTSAATVPIIHSKDIGVSYEALRLEKEERVTVVGAAKSAYDAVYLLVAMGKEATWTVRPDGTRPLAILPVEIFGVFNSIAVASTRLMTYLSPSILNTDGVFYRLFQKSSMGCWLTGKFLGGGHPPERRTCRLHRRVVPLAHAARGERSLAMLRKIHTVQTPLLAEVQSFWAILYLLGELELPLDMSVMEQEVA